MSTIVLVEGVQRWSMVDEETKQPIKGSKIFVKDIDDNNNVLRTPDKVGSFPTTFNLPYEAYEQFADQVPGYFDVDFAMKIGSKGQFTVKRVEFVGETPEVTKK